MATAPTPATPAAASKATKKEDRQNVLKFNVAGWIPVNTKQMSTITKAVDAFNSALEALKKAGATITRDEEPQFTTVNTKTGEDADEE